MAWKEESIALHKRVAGFRFGTSSDYHFLILSLAGEAGELANIAKKDWRYEWGFPTEDPDGMRDAMIKEAADVMIYLTQLAASMDFDLDGACQAKWNEVKARPELSKYLSEPEKPKCPLCGENVTHSVEWIEACPRADCPMR